MLRCQIVLALISIAQFIHLPLCSRSSDAEKFSRRISQNFSARTSSENFLAKTSNENLQWEFPLECLSFRPHRTRVTVKKFDSQKPSSSERQHWQLVFVRKMNDAFVVLARSSSSILFRLLAFSWCSLGELLDRESWLSFGCSSSLKSFSEKFPVLSSRTTSCFQYFKPWCAFKIRIQNWFQILFLQFIQLGHFMVIVCQRLSVRDFTARDFLPKSLKMLEEMVRGWQCDTMGVHVNHAGCHSGSLFSNLTVHGSAGRTCRTLANHLQREGDKKLDGNF